MPDIVHIYPGTSGSAGLYIHAIFGALKNNFTQEVIVNYYYPFNYGRKKYYKYSELSAPNIIHRYDQLRLIVRYFELLFSSLYTLLYVMVKKTKIINYSLTSQFDLEYCFLVLIKKLTKIKICITAHDTIPFQAHWDSNYEKTVLARRKFFLIADHIIIHNYNSLKELVDFYKIDESKIIKYPFPVMDLNELPTGKLMNKTKELFDRNKTSFVFVGHVRKEKGINILLTAWEKITSSDNIKDIELIIAGNMSKEYYNSVKTSNGLKIVNRFLNDQEYKSLIKNADCVILPYTRGTNSGIPSSVLALGTKLIASNIPMFQKNILIDKNFLFKNKDIDDLLEKMYYVLKNNVEYTFPDINKYNKYFAETINKKYKLLLN